MMVHVDAVQLAPSGAGCSHARVTLTAGGVQRVVLVGREELMQQEPPADAEELRERLVDRLRSAIKESGATTPAQARTAILNKDFSL